MGLQGGPSTVCRSLNNAGLLLGPSYEQELHENGRTRKRHLHRRTEPNQLWPVPQPGKCQERLASPGHVVLTQVPISDYGVYSVTSVVERCPHQALDYRVPPERYYKQALREAEQPETQYTLMP